MAVTFPYVRAAVWADGSTTDTAAKRNTIEDGIFNAHQAPAVHVTHNAAQSITTATTTTIALNTERFDVAGGAASTQHDTATNNSRLTALYAGKYLITGNIEVSAGGTAHSQFLIIRLNGSAEIAKTYCNAANATATNVLVTVLYDLAVNDYVELRFFQNSGGSINVNSTGNVSPEFMMVRVA